MASGPRFLLCQRDNFVIFMRLNHLDELLVDLLHLLLLLAHELLRGLQRRRLRSRRRSTCLLLFRRIILIWHFRAILSIILAGVAGASAPWRACNRLFWESSLGQKCQNGGLLENVYQALDVVPGTLFIVFL